jgi:hypothetical protein
MVKTGMAEKKRRQTLEEIAREEAEEIAGRAARAAEYYAKAERLSKEMPQFFFTFAGWVRDTVKRFNDNADPNRRISWTESAALATKDNNVHADFNFQFGRDGDEVSMALKEMGRSGPKRPDAFVIEGYGHINKNQFLIRVEGQIPNKDLVLKTTINFQKIEKNVEVVPEMVIRALVKRDFDLLFPDPRRDRDEA